MKLPFHRCLNEIKSIIDTILCCRQLYGTMNIVYPYCIINYVPVLNTVDYIYHEYWWYNVLYDTRNHDTIHRMTYVLIAQRREMYV